LRIIEDTQHHILVVAEEADPLVRGPPTKDQPLYDIARLRTAVDVVAQENLDAALRRRPLHVATYVGVKRLEQVVAAVDVADRIDPQACREAWRRPRCLASEPAGE
jgi:hypothetical protein